MEISKTIVPSIYSELEKKYSNYLINVHGHELSYFTDRTTQMVKKAHEISLHVLATHIYHSAVMLIGPLMHPPIVQAGIAFIMSDVETFLTNLRSYQSAVICLFDEKNSLIKSPTLLSKPGSACK